MTFGEGAGGLAPSTWLAPPLPAVLHKIIIISFIINYRFFSGNSVAIILGGDRGVSRLPKMCCRPTRNLVKNVALFACNL